jgi:hypothetical protein
MLYLDMMDTCMHELDLENKLILGEIKSTDKNFVFI